MIVRDSNVKEIITTGKLKHLTRKPNCTGTNKKPNGTRLQQVVLREGTAAPPQQTDTPPPQPPQQTDTPPPANKQEMKS